MSNIYHTPVDTNLRFLIEPEGDILVNMEDSALGYEGQKVGQIVDGVAYFTEPEDAIRGILHSVEFDGKSLESLAEGKDVKTVADIHHLLEDELGITTKTGAPEFDAEEPDPRRYDMTYINSKGKEKTYEFADGHKGFGVKVTDFDSALEFATKAAAGWGVELTGVEYAEDADLDFAEAFDQFESIEIGL